MLVLLDDDPDVENPTTVAEPLQVAGGDEPARVVGGAEFRTFAELMRDYLDGDGPAVGGGEGPCDGALPPPCAVEALDFRAPFALQPARSRGARPTLLEAIDDGAPCTEEPTGDEADQASRELTDLEALILDLPPEGDGIEQ